MNIEDLAIKKVTFTHFKEYSEISGQLKHHNYFLTSIDRYSLNQFMFKIPVG